MICKNIIEVVEAFNTFNFKVFSLDVETNDTVRYDVLKLTVISLYDGKNSIYIDINPGTLEYVRTYFKAFVNNPSNLVICHNITFDMKVLHKYNISLEDCEYFDTLVAVHLIDENLVDKRLKTLAKTILGKEVIYYDDIKGDKDITNPKFIEYALNDTIFTYELAVIYKKLLFEQGMTKLFREIEMPFLKVLMHIEVNGILVDKEKIEETTKKLLQKKIDLECSMYDLLGIKYSLQTNLMTGDVVPISNINLNSNVDISHILFDTLELEIVETSKKTGKASTGKRTINTLKSKHEFVQLLDTYKLICKLLSSFFEPLPEFIDSDGRVRPGYRDTGTVTGRLSSNNPNIQQLPKINKKFPVNTRECFIVPTGKKIITVDYSQQELRIAAELTKDKALIEVLENDGDLHLINANNVFNLGIPKEHLFKSYPGFEKLKDEKKADRDKGKIFSFGIMYGMGKHKLSKDFNVSLEEAEVMLENYFKGFPEMKETIDEVHKSAEEDLYVTTLYGRRRHFQRNQWNKLDDKSLRQSFNFLIQSVGADLIRLSLIKVYDFAKKNPKYGILPIMTVHDELSVEVNEQYAAEVLGIIEQLMESCADFVVPLKAEGHLGNSYGEVK